MTSTTVNGISYSQAAPSTVAASLQALWFAAQNLATAVWHAASGKAAAHPATPFQEAESLRTFAASVQKSDPDFALDLFIAADRHEAKFGA
jgi:hypothetical protein